MDDGKTKGYCMDAFTRTIQGGARMKYKIEFELPDNDTVLENIKSAWVHWGVWGYSGDVHAKPVVEEERKNGKWIVLSVNDSRGRRTGYHLIQCVHCGFKKQIWHSADIPKFCESCGSEMRGTQE